MMWFDYIAEWLWRFLVAQSIYAAILFVAVFAISLIARKKSPLLHLALWTLVLIRFILPPDLSQPASLRMLVESLKPLQTEHWSFDTVHDQVGASYSSAAERAANATHQDMLPLWKRAMLLLWVSSVFGFSVIFIFRRFWWRTQARCAQSIDDKSLTVQLAELQAHYKVRRNVRLKFSATSQSPFTIGLLRPVIVIPIALIRDGARTTIKAALAHEMAHIKRYDDLRILMQNIIQIIFFFHPAIWLTNHFIYSARECVCDSMAIAAGKLSPQNYGQCLLSAFSEFSGGRQTAIVFPAFSSPASAVKRRIQIIR